MERRQTSIQKMNRIIFIAGLLFLIMSVLPGKNSVWAEMPLSSEVLKEGGSLIADIAESSVAGVVNISSTKLITADAGQLMHPFFNDPFFRDFFGQRFYNIPKERRERSLGSGVIISKDGLILTNNHVVENTEEILVTLSDKRELEAEIVGTDPKSDVAVIRLKGNTEDLTPLPIGNSGELRLGDIVLAIGNPFGLDHTVTMGIVSAKGRANVGITDYEDFIQTDAAINPGNSGGALINLKGELVGINTAIVTRSGGYQGVGFAIPSNMAKAVMDSLIKHGKVVRGWLGVAIQDLDKDLSEAMGLKDINGVLVSDVTENSPAAKAKLERGDVILRVNGEKMTSTGRLRNTIAAMGAGTEVQLDLMRDGKEKTVPLTLGELPDDFGGQATLQENDGLLGGITVAPLNELTREKFEINKNVKTGVAITQVEGGSTAEQAGLRSGDVILEINRQNVNSVEDFEKVYKKSKDSLLMLIYRQNSTFYLVLRK
ncbi:MAG: DegQ family serine endoprotease [Proteobacteria bacterium]|nr:DegQ family serine endoprotease [Pseudomonadota bacterium]MBU1137466.1 DegQ family serine endoprotease [Pseudomonadota bacterium]MBU1419886.1 DegQ family serine endoprotease [Pseudomonadota bacterium]MBU1453313.1 DegQ family serine endoprotease [Pseudomonadota bacterium]